MATRQHTGTAAVQPAPAVGPGIEQLPDDVLVHILGLLDSPSRHAAALVSQRWHNCAHAPKLCRDAALDLTQLSPTAQPAALDSLAAWLLRHGQHVRSLKLEHFEEGAVERLQIDWGSQLLVAAWAPSLRSLRQLQLFSVDGGVVVSSSLHGLTQLTLLSLAGEYVQFCNDARLPTSLERLTLADRFSGALPSQVSALARLADLHLENGSWAADGYTVLTRLPAMTRLQLCSNEHLPSCLDQLSGLQALVVEGVTQQAAEALNAALQPLTRLTSLWLSSIAAAGGLPALARLPHLRQVHLGNCSGLESLPAGPWCSSLHTVAASWDCLQGSGEFLAAAKQLQRVVALGPARSPDHSFLKWAAAHPALRQLRLVLDGLVPAYLLGALLRLQQARPQLAIHQSSSREFFGECCSQDGMRSL